MIIYKITNTINGMVYIGQTSRTLNQRMAEHLANSRTSYIDRALKKYGIQNFEVDVIAEADTKEELDALEKYFIKHFDCKIPNGYNLTDGGEGQCGIQRFGEDNPHYGKHHTDSAKKRIGEARRKYTKEKHPSARHIHNLDTGEIFLCMVFACEKYGLDRSTLTKACSGKRKTCGGFRWEYV